MIVKRLSVVFFAIIFVSQFSLSMKKKKIKMTNKCLYDEFVYSDAIFPFVRRQNVQRVLLKFRVACKCLKKAVAIFSEKNPIKWKRNIRKNNYKDFLKIMESIDFFISFMTYQGFLFSNRNLDFENHFSLIKKKLKSLAVFSSRYNSKYYNNVCFVDNFKNLNIDSLMLSEWSENFWLQNLPKSLRVLKFDECKNIGDYCLTNLLKLKNLKILDIRCKGLDGSCFKYFPKVVEEVILPKYVNIDFLKDLPSSIKILDFSYVCFLTKKLKDEDVSIFEDDLPENLQKLKKLKVGSLESVMNIKNLEKLPRTLSHVYITDENEWHYVSNTNYSLSMHRNILAIKKLRDLKIKVLNSRGEKFPDFICKCQNCLRPVMVKFTVNQGVQIISGRENLGYYRRDNNRKLELNLDDF